LSTAAISTQVLIEFYSAATKKLPSGRLDAEAVMPDWTGWMTIHRLAGTDILRAVELQRRQRITVRNPFA
jgi:predicted nucleic acid-binding protein